MSQPPSARPSPTGSPAVRPQAINLEGIYTNIPILINRVRNNQLATNQIPPLRNLIANHAKEIIIFHARLGRNNPLLNLPDLLNPTKKVNGYEAITTEAAFLGQVGQGVAAARSIRPDQALIAAMAAKQQAARPPPARPPAGPADARASPQPQQPAMSIQQVRELIAMPTEERNKKLDADLALKARFVASYQFYQRRSAQVKGGTPGAPAVRPPAAGSASTQGSSVASPAASPAPTPATPSIPSAPATPTLPNAANAAPRPPPAPTSAANTPGVAQQGKPASPAPPPTHPGAPPVRPAGTPSGSSTPATPTLPNQPPQQHHNPAPPPPIHIPAPPPPPVVIPQRPPSPPRPPPPPPEPEPQRRRRKLREYLREQAPGLAVEYGMDELFNEVLDNLVESATRDSVRLAAHRNSGRVELKDMAFALEQYQDIVVPGFNAQVPKRVHAESDSSKRARMVAPRARRKDDE